ncbi:MAG TPA: sulfotransferase [Rhizomicrobium sp.]|nr:sulfotransferase [Rhizomicrobium sp.]
MSHSAPGQLQAALAQGRKMLDARPDLAEAQAREILRVLPGEAQAELLLANALRLQGRPLDALSWLEPLAAARPGDAGVQFELGLAFSAAGATRDAIAAFTRTTRLNARHAQAWRALGDEKSLAGDAEGAEAAYAQHIRASVNDPRLLEAASALCDSRLAVAERLLRAFLMESPTDVAAIRMLAEVAARLGRYDDAEKLLARALELAPAFDAARHNYAIVLNRASKHEQALAQAEILLERDARNPGYRALQAAVLSHVGEYEKASEVYGKLLAEYPDQPKGWMSYGHSLKTLGRTTDGIEAYRQAIARLPGLGEAWWSLANLKTFRFTPGETGTMRAQLARGDLAPDDRFHFEFALAKALEDAGAFEESFAHYIEANALRRKSQRYSADRNSRFAGRLKAFFTPELFARFAGTGSPAQDPIFIVGLPRSGSTLVEQILASHSMVEGTMELHDIGQLSRGVGFWATKEGEDSYPEALADLPRERFRQLGDEYLSRTRVHRRLGRARFIDKMPNNFLHAGFIRLILPDAKIVDTRRHPLGCCLSCFKQHFARGQSFTYGLEDLGRYYADYVALMAHYDKVLPGAVHRVFYEDLVADPEAGTRRLLEFCGLPFEEGCLRFYENARAVRTASSEQVRRPIFADAVEHWQNFEPWLGPLKDALGQVLTAYPAVPTF